VCGDGRANIWLAELWAPALCVRRAVGLQPLGRQEVVRSAGGEALGRSLPLVLACVTGSG